MVDHKAIAYDAIDSVRAGLKAVSAINPNCKGMAAFVDVKRDNIDGYPVHDTEVILYFKDGIGIKVVISVDHMPT